MEEKKKANTINLCSPDSEHSPVICRKKETANDNTLSKRRLLSYQHLSINKTGRQMEPYIIDIASADGVDFIMSTHRGEEFLYVLEGTVEINYGKETYTIEEGDSIYYDSIVEHHVHSIKNETAKILAVIYTPD
jgi:Uncharacterized conserved protein, contains double-stranded beta-helix domain